MKFVSRDGTVRKSSFKKDFAKKEYAPRNPDGVKPASFKATCADCGNACTVPFKPNGKKPVLCSSCFNKNGDGPAREPWKKSGPAKFGADRPTFNAQCDRCGVTTTVPFRPIPGKPIFCNTCLGHGDKKPIAGAGGADYTKQFAEINAKLDDIMKAIEAMNE